MADYERRISTVVNVLLWVFNTMNVFNETRELYRRRRRGLRQHTSEQERIVSFALEEYEAAAYEAEYEADIIVRHMRHMRHMREQMLLGEFFQNKRCRPSAWAINRSSHWWENIVPGFSSTQWLQNFRMSEDTFTYLCHKLRPYMEHQDTKFRQCVPLRKRVAIALWKLATGSEYRSIGHLFGVSNTTVCRCVQDFCVAAESLLVPEQLRFPDEGRFREMSAYIESRWGLPMCVGAIDGSHIPIIAPTQYHTDYFNRKGWHSVLLQGVVDGKGLFWNVFAGLPGSMHDARVLRLSTLWDLASRENLFPPKVMNLGAVRVGYFILGDSAYPLQNWLLKTFHDTGRLTEEQHTFNQTISRVRVVVENAFGRLKGRWRCLLKRNDCNIALVKSMVLTCCALHNLCESHGEAFDTTLDDAADEEVVVAASQGVEEQGGDIRDAVMQHLCSNQ
ncbi:uncharacterized protein KZ484_022706 [Pholidichthys leucotaenia]